MKFAVGYQLAEGEETPFPELIAPYTRHIAEVYFPWLDTASGRSPLATRRGHTDWGAQERLEGDLRRLKESGIRLDLLFNANCYGRESISEALRNRVCSILERLELAAGGADVVTTTSPFIAETVKRYFPRTEVRASVNMWIGTVKAMSYLADLFDSYYVQREYNRDLDTVRTLREWCDANGKGLYMLANSGCMRFCTGHSFHDNLVAHEAEIAETRNVTDFTPYTCWRLLKNKENWPLVLQNTWVRPEDLHHYEGLIPLVKLATRMHAHPLLVIDAYVRGRFAGNLLDLFEPGYGPAFSPYVVDNTRLPNDFFERTSNCDQQCHRCDACRLMLEDALVRMEDAPS